MSEVGNFIAIEGGDGSGKATQTEITYQFLANELGKTVLKLSFPQYGQPSAVYAEKYLNGDFGSADDVPADLGVLPFAIDRFAAKPIIEAQLQLPEGLVITDRYVASNLAHQGTKILDEKVRHEFYERTMHTEYRILGIPKPNINIVLLLPTDMAQLNVDKKGARAYTTMKRDIHEASSSHLDRAKANYEELCELYPDEFIAVQCLDDKHAMRSIQDIQTEIRRVLGV
jgi:dTMP kinase